MSKTTSFFMGKRNKKIICQFIGKIVDIGYFRWYNDLINQNFDAREDLQKWQIRLHIF